jgi:ABC-type nitrate/sulfonate/bicarbonate transport system substrate-binding protein
MTHRHLRRHSRRHLRRTLPALLAGVLLATSATACGGASGATQDADGTTTLRYQTGPGLMNYAELADALGYFEHVELDYVGQVQGGPEALRALATDQIDFANAFQGAIAKVVATGVPVTAVVASYGSTEDVDMQLLVPESSPIRSGKDLIGAKVAVNTLGANSEAIIDTYLAEEGLSPQEIAKVTLVPLPGVNQEAALRDGTVDAALLSFATKEFALASGGLRPLATDTDLVGTYNGGSYAVADSLIEENPEAAREFVAGVAKAIEYERTHDTAEVLEVYGDWLDAHDRSEEKQIYELWAGNGVATEGGVLDEKDFTIWLDWLDAEGEVDADSLDVSEIFTNDLNPYAKDS